MSTTELIIGTALGFIALLCVIGLITLIIKKISKKIELELNNYTHIYIKGRR